MVLSVPAAAGILLADGQTWQPQWPLILITLLVWLPFLYRRRLWTAAPALMLTFGFLHSLRLADTFEHPLRTQLLATADHAMDVTLRGHLYPWNKGAELDEDAALCSVTAIRPGRHGSFQPLKAKIKVRLPEGWSLTAPGVYEISGRLSLPRPPMNPGQFDSVNYGLRMGWIAHLRAQEINLVEEDAIALRFHLLHAAETSRQWITKQLSLGLEKEDKDAAVILAMALGASDAAGEDIEDAFRDSGTLHVFAVSGLHVVMLAHIASMGLRWLGTQRMSLAIILIVFAYAFITGWQPSAARAAFMLAIVLTGPLLYRRSQLPNTLGAAALILLFFDSHQLFLPGFQLSFGVLLAILFMSGGIAEQARPWCELDPFLPPALATPFQRLGVWAKLKIASLFSVTAAAWAGSLPLMILHFGSITPVALVSNLFLVPASELCLIFSCFSLSFATLHCSGMAIFLNVINAQLAKGMVMLATWFASLPAANYTLDLRFEKAPPPAEIRVLHVPFGGGAGYLRSGEERWLLDTGNDNNWRYVLRPFLQHDGINNLDGLILSHGDISHVGAAPRVLKMQKHPRIHTSLLEPWPSDPATGSLKTLSRAIPPDGPIWKRHGLGELINLHSGHGMPVTAQVLHPGPADLHEKANDRGLVLLIQAGPFRVLWLNDAGFITEKRLLERRAPVQCDILVRHQHNADFSGLTELLLAAQPRAIISSNDAYRTEEALPQRLRDHCQAQQIPLFDLEASGSVGIEFWDEFVELKGYGNGQSVRLSALSELR
ncbi:ComEC/Rec2 family competence protein [Prosthecobacter fusiformis]|uniref:ComEC/Rec2 family competence protein n=1 Tax=Prosthecobacter fusiformis TaxID=48464 RepID=UPI001414FDAF|nr:ComEC/Rec2 family competence protein [Prosthecobacter fusiformis]